MICKTETLSFGYLASDLIFKDIDFSLDTGELVTALGPNGAGKSTFLKCLLGELKSTKGKILINGIDINDLSVRQIAQTLAYVPQTASVPAGFTVLEYVMMGRASTLTLFQSPGKQDAEKANEAIEILGLDPYTYRKIETLSGGEFQMVMLARAISADPLAIILDEPTAHLDYPNQIKVLRLIKELNERGYAIILTTHDINQALMLGGDALLFDGQGNIKQGPSDKILTESNLQSVYGQDIKIRYLDEFKCYRSICPSL